MLGEGLARGSRRAIEVNRTAGRLDHLRFEAKPAHFPKASSSRKGGAPKAPKTAREMIERCEQALPLPDLMTWLLEQEPEGATDELLYWFSRLSRESRFQRERLERRQYLTREHEVSLASFALVGQPNG